jgi:glycine betaine/choline ABC-type transport system substrate-binding protein
MYLARRPRRSLATLGMTLGLLLFTLCSSPEKKPLTVGSKNFTESVILGELVAQKLESAGCRVDRRLNMGGTFVCDSAVRSGAIDAYVEYSGTALTAILKQPKADVAREYEKRGLRWSPPLGFNNTFAMIVRRVDAQRLALSTISDLKKVEATFRPGFGYEFTERPDGWSGLQRAYSLAFAHAPISTRVAAVRRRRSSRCAARSTTRPCAA